MKTLILSAACICLAIVSSAGPAVAISTSSARPAAATTISTATNGTSHPSIINGLKLELSQNGTTFLTARCEKMTYYIPATGNRIAPSVFSLQIRMKTEHAQWAWKISTPILSGTLPSALFSVQLTF